MPNVIDFQNVWIYSQGNCSNNFLWLKKTVTSCNCHLFAVWGAKKKKKHPLTLNVTDLLFTLYTKCMYKFYRCRGGCSVISITPNHFPWRVVSTVADWTHPVITLSHPVSHQQVCKSWLKGLTLWASSPKIQRGFFFRCFVSVGSY